MRIWTADEYLDGSLKYRHWDRIDKFGKNIGFKIVKFGKICQNKIDKFGKKGYDKAVEELRHGF